LLALVSSLPLQAEIYGRGWASYFGDHRLAGRWGIHFDGQLRDDFSSSARQILLRPGANFYLRDNLFLTQGYLLVRNHDGPRTLNEHRSWQQLQFMPQWGPLLMSHRFRIEQRWIGVGNTHRYQNRFRYFYRTEVPARGSHFIGLQNEIFLGFGPNRGASTYDQNRAYISLGKRFGPVGRIEAGYMYQNVLRRDGFTRDHNHIAVISFLSAYRFRR
jgi:hypothetical protein